MSCDVRGAQMIEWEAQMIEWKAQMTEWTNGSLIASSTRVHAILVIDPNGGEWGRGGWVTGWPLP